MEKVYHIWYKNSSKKNIMSDIFHKFLVLRRHGGRRCDEFEPFLDFMSSNVSAVYDVFASPKKETVGFQGLQKCGGEKMHKGAKRRLRFFVARTAYWR
jgi:hypothetical protein